MAKYTLGDQVTIAATGEKGMIVGESDGRYDVRIGTSDTRRGLRARDLKRFVPEFSSPMNNTFMMDVGGLTGGRWKPGDPYQDLVGSLRAAGATVTTAGGETKEEQMAFAAKIRASVAEMERNPDTARARQHRAMVDQLASASTLHPAEVDAATRAQQARRTERRAQGKTSDCVVCAGPAASSCGRCKTVKYCSKNCQKLDWPRHKATCETARKSREVSKAGRAGA